MMISLQIQGLFFAGWIGDRVDPRYLVSIGMCGSAVIVTHLNIIHKYHKYVSVNSIRVLTRMAWLLQSRILYYCVYTIWLSTKSRLAESYCRCC
jgi:hypothetical protein